MLESIRQSAQSFWVKVAFAIIILVFVFWGVGNFNDRDYSNVVAMVNGTPITAREFEKAYHNTEEFLLKQNPALTRQELQKQHLGRHVLQELVQLTLLNQEAQRAGISPTPLEMRREVEKNRAFLDQEGKFDPEAYQRILAAQRIQPADFEADLAANMAREKLAAVATASIYTDQEETRRRYDYLAQQRSISFRFLPAIQFMDKATISEAEARTWYDAHLADFAIPAKVDIQYIRLSPANVVNPDSISTAAAKIWYEANKSKFEIPEQIHVAHILIKHGDTERAKNAGDIGGKIVAEYNGQMNESDHNKGGQETRKDVPEKFALEQVRKALLNGADFAAVADKINTVEAGGKGGDIGWIGRGQTVPEFEEVAFSLNPGELSPIVETPFGYHIIKTIEKRPAGVKPFSEVEKQAKEALAAEEGADKIHEVLDGLIEDNILGKNLDETAAKYGLKAEDSGLMDKDAFLEKLGISSQGADALLATPQGSALDTALDAGDSYIIARVLKSAPASTMSFEQARDELEVDLKKEKALELAIAEADKILNMAKDATYSDMEAKKLDLSQPENIRRGASLPGFLPDESLSEDIFHAKPHSWLSKPFSVIKVDEKKLVNPDLGKSAAADALMPGAIIVHVNNIIPPAAKDFEKAKDTLAQSLRQERQDAVMGMLLQKLASRAKIEVTNPALVDKAE